MPIRPTRRARTVLVSIAQVGGAVVVAAWLVGLTLSDRTTWSQWLGWIPSVAPLAAAAAVALICVAGRARRWKVLCWASITVFIGAYALGIEHRVLRSCSVATSAEGTLCLVHWNLRWVGEREALAFAEAIDAFEADVMICSNAGRLTASERGRRWTDRGTKVIPAGDFLVITDLPVVEARSFTGGLSDIELAVVQIAPHGREPLTIVTVDLPSWMQHSRMDVAGRVRALMERADAPKPDIVIGDFNVTAGSASLELMFPNLEDAYQLAGCGWGGTFPRWCPLWRIDLMLVAEQMNVESYRLLDAGCGDHRAQVAHLRLSGSPAADAPAREAAP